MTEHYKTHTKLIIWFNYRATGAMLLREIEKKFEDKLNVQMMRGGTKTDARQEAIDAFNVSSIIDSENKCMILQSSAFMHGIDVVCSTSYYYSRTFNNEEWLQTQDRTHGINRGEDDESSTYYISRIAGTIEDTIDKALNWKKSISDLILRDGIAIRNIMEGNTSGT
jgi:SNF2 family DNA or RNA helicase